MSKIKDGVFGAAIGDAMGVPIEFRKREDLLDNPVTSMIGGGTYNMPAGVWSNSFLHWKRSERHVCFSETSKGQTLNSITNSTAFHTLRPLYRSS